MGLDAHYKSLIQRADASLNELALDTESFSSFTAAHNYGSEFETLIYSVSNRPESVVFKMALREYYFSLYACAGGSYRHGHIGLRLFLELFCSGIMFSAHEIKLRLWLNNHEESDINWGSIANSEFGIFSTSFLRAFNPEITTFGKQYRTIASKVYRECSEFVHGNIHTHDLEDKPICFQEDVLKAWLERAAAARICVLFLFAGRYLPLITKEMQGKVEPIMVENLGHMSAIQAIYR